MMPTTKVLTCLIYVIIYYRIYNIVDEKIHEAKKEADKAEAHGKDVLDKIGDSLSHAYHYVAEKVSGL